MIEFVDSKTYGVFELNKPNYCFTEFKTVIKINELSIKGWCRIIFENNVSLDVGDIILIARDIEQNV